MLKCVVNGIGFCCIAYLGHQGLLTKATSSINSYSLPLKEVKIYCDTQGWMHLELLGRNISRKTWSDFCENGSTAWCFNVGHIQSAYAFISKKVSLVNSVPCFPELELGLGLRLSNRLIRLRIKLFCK